MSTKTIILSKQIRSSDVLMGRGARVAKHPGNVRLRALVQIRKQEYNGAISTAATSSRQIKQRIAQEIMDEIMLQQHGRFLLAVDNALRPEPGPDDTWTLADPSEAIEKIKQALREKESRSRRLDSDVSSAATTTMARGTLPSRPDFADSMVTQSVVHLPSLDTPQVPKQPHVIRPTTREYTLQLAREDDLRALASLQQQCERDLCALQDSMATTQMLLKQQQQQEHHQFQRPCTIGAKFSPNSTHPDPDIHAPALLLAFDDDAAACLCPPILELVMKHNRDMDHCLTLKEKEDCVVWSKEPHDGTETSTSSCSSATQWTSNKRQKLDDCNALALDQF